MSGRALLVDPGVSGSVEGLYLKGFTTPGLLLSSWPAAEDAMVTFGRELLQPKQQQTTTKTQQPATPEKAGKKVQKPAAAPATPGGRHLLNGE